MASPTSDYFAAPLEDNLFEWHFTVRGPEDTDFQVIKVMLTSYSPFLYCQGGIYHGRIIVPAEYPMKPPDIIFLTVDIKRSFSVNLIISIRFAAQREV